MKAICKLFIFVFLFSSVTPVFAQRTDIDPPVTKKVMVINFNPIIESANNQRLTAVNAWNDPNILNTQYINDIHEISGGYVNYQIVENLTIDAIPVKQDGFQYTDATYMQCWQNHDTCHSPDTVNYNKILTDYDVCGKRNRGEIDELWIFGGPWFGYYESIMAGQNAFWTNGPVLSNTTCQKQLHIMGFNYERGVSEMLEDLAHRTEGTMVHLYGEEPRDSPYPHQTAWGKFAIYNKAVPGQAGCGWIHYPPNGVQDYDWSNTTQVINSCEDWLNYPNLTGVKQTFGCERWSCNGYAWKKYWFNHLPRYSGMTNSKWNNWWRYIIDYEQAVTGQPFPSDNPVYTISNLKTITSYYLLNLDAGFRFIDNKINILDLGYILNRIRF